MTKLYSVELHVAVRHSDIRNIIAALRDDLLKSYAPVDIGGSYRRGSFEVWLTVSANSVDDASNLAHSAVLESAIRAESLRLSEPLPSAEHGSDPHVLRWIEVKQVDVRAVQVTADGIELEAV